MREMRLKKREITDPEILREILESCEAVRIGAMELFTSVCTCMGQKKGGRRLHLQRIRAWRWRWITTMK